MHQAADKKESEEKHKTIITVVAGAWSLPTRWAGEKGCCLSLTLLLLQHSPLSSILHPSLASSTLSLSGIKASQPLLPLQKKPFDHDPTLSHLRKRSRSLSFDNYSFCNNDSFLSVGNLHRLEELMLKD